VAASVDQLADARKTVAEHGLSFAVGYGLDALEIANRYGAFFEGEKKFLHATGFLIKQGRKRVQRRLQHGSHRSSDSRGLAAAHRLLSKARRAEARSSRKKGLLSVNTGSSPLHCRG